ncbi:hypothetical protein MMC30_000829 [Trapelia coarctata]|nr:hypothetical protein [Trapelia coarctata]
MAALSIANKHWFTIVPENNEAIAIVNDTQNRERVVPLSSDPTTLAIVITFSDYLKPNCVLSFGYDEECSVICEGEGYSRKQCHFFLLNKSLMIRDDSPGCSTSIVPVGIDSEKWISTRPPRQWAVLEEGLWKLKIGVVEFCLRFEKSPGRWWEQNVSEKQALANRRAHAAYELTAPDIGPPLEQSPTEFHTPQVPAHKMRDSVIYHELELLGRGGYGTVSRVVDLKYGGMMAVKIARVCKHEEKEGRELLRHEVEMLARLSHPHIIDYTHSQGWELGEPIEIFMSLADGSLGDRLEQLRETQTKMTMAEISLVSKQVIDALAYLHEKSVIHRDIKPENILYKDIDTNPTFYLADFGLAKKVDLRTTFVGTKPYMAPEMLAEDPQEPRLDIWPFGLVIYEMLSGLDLCRLYHRENFNRRPEEWCMSLESACRGRGDLAKTVTWNYEERITSHQGKASPKFPDLAESFPSPVPPQPVARPSSSARQTRKRRSILRSRSVILAPAHASRVEKSGRRPAAQTTPRPQGPRSGPGRGWAFFQNLRTMLFCNGPLIHYTRY